jgi:hypothetical protein
VADYHALQSGEQQEINRAAFVSEHLAEPAQAAA